MEGPKEPLVSGIDTMHIPNLHPPAAAPGALGNNRSITPGQGGRGRRGGIPPATGGDPRDTLCFGWG